MYKGQALRLIPSRPYSTVDLPYTMADLAALRFRGYDETRSLFSPRFRSRPRWVGNYSYEAVIDLTHRAEEQQRTPSYAASFFKGL